MFLSRYFWLTALTSLVAIHGPAQGETSIVENAKHVITIGNAISPFPAGFLGHPIAYAMAVFAQLMIFSFALGILMYIGKAIDFRRDGCWRNGRYSWRSPVNVYRMQWVLLMIAVCLGVGPNLLVYLSWGDVSGQTMAVFLTIDKVFKAIGVIPFVAAVYLFVENDEDVVLHLAMHKTYPDPLWPIQDSVRQHVRTAFLVALGSITITLTKYYGL